MSGFALSLSTLKALRLVHQESEIFCFLFRQTQRNKSINHALAIGKVEFLCAVSTTKKGVFQRGINLRSVRLMWLQKD